MKAVTVVHIDDVYHFTVTDDSRIVSIRVSFNHEPHVHVDEKDISPEVMNKFHTRLVKSAFQL